MVFYFLSCISISEMVCIMVSAPRRQVMPEGSAAGRTSTRSAATILPILATPLMMFGEAFLSGGAMALIVVYRPHWCSTFDDARYLNPH